MKKPRMKDIAEDLGVSINAVSLALNHRKGVGEDLRMKVFNAAKSIGYLEQKPKIRGAFGRYAFCAMIQDFYRNESFYGDILCVAEKTARNNGYNTFIHYFNDQNMEIPDCIEKRYVSGIFILGKLSLQNVEKLVPYNIPIVVVDHMPMQSPVSCILTDNKSGGFLAANYLIRSGFTKIGFFGDLSYSLSVRDRYYGFLEALAFNGLVKTESKEKYSRRYSIIGEIENYIISGNLGAIAKIVSKRKELPEAFFCSNDSAAAALVNALKINNISVPDSISIIGFDYGHIAHSLVPKLASVRIQKELMGSKAVEKLIRLINGQDSGVEHIVLGVELVEGASVKPK